jgi:hypothetical protein
MKNIVFLVMVLQTYAITYSQNAAINVSQREYPVQIDTIQISPNIQKMIFKYYYSSKEYDFKGAIRNGRFEIYFLGDTIPFQKDTIFGFSASEYKDINGDGILDLVVTTRLATNGGGSDFKDILLYNPRTKRFELSESDTRGE